MADRTSLLSKRRLHARATLADPYGMLRRASTVAWLRLVVAAESRQTRARLGMLGVPLEITASLIAGLWWTALPLTLCAWWWAPRNTGWEWIGAIGRGLIGAEWALIGSSAIVNFPHHLLIVGALWSLGAGLLGLCGSGAVRQTSHVRARSRQGSAVHMRHNSVPSVRKRFAMHMANQRSPGVARKRH
jgi:hypothetical protein